MFKTGSNCQIDAWMESHELLTAAISTLPIASAVCKQPVTCVEVEWEKVDHTTGVMFFANPNNALLQEKSYKFAIHFHCLIPPKWEIFDNPCTMIP